MGPGAPIDRFPAPLERISARWDWVDLRFFSQSALSRFRFGAQYDPQVAKVHAKIFDIEDGDLPILNREFVRARAKVRRNLAIAAGVVIVGLSGLTTWALLERDRAVAAEQVAIQQRDEAVRQRNAALISQSRFLAKTADGLVAAGTVRGAIALLRQALPDPAAGRDRPLVPDAIASAYKAIFANHERGRLAMPEGAAAVATDGAAGQIVIASADKIYIRQGLTTDAQRILPHDFGAPARIVLSPDGERLVMIGRDGIVALRDLQSNNVLARHPGEGAGTRAVFLQGGRRLLIMDAGQKNLHLVDIASGGEVAARGLSGSNGKAIVSLIEPDADLLAFIDDEQLIRLSVDDLNDAATFKIENADEYAMALSPDKSTIYLAAAKVILNGRLMALDSKTLALQRTFGRVSWGAKGMEITQRWNMLALRGLGGIDFYDIKEGDRIYHVTANFPVAGGRFLGGSTDSDYMAYGSDGSIRRWAPELGIETSAYMTIDGGAIQQLDPLKDRSGFLSISDRPSITNWAFETRNISKEYSTPLVVNGTHLNFPMPMGAFNFASSRGEVTAAYSGNVVQRWNLETGAMKIVKQAGQAEEAIAQVAGLQDGISVISRASGQIQIYSDSGGDAQPVGTIKFEPLAYLGEISATQAFLVTKSGVAGRLDVSTPSEPKIEMLPALGVCAGKVAIPGFAVCVSADGTTRIVRDADGTLVADWPAPAGGMGAAYIADDGARMAIGDNGGQITVRSVPDGNVLENLTLTGANKLDAAVAARSIALAKDNVHLAAAIPNGSLKLVDLKTGAVRDIQPYGRGAVVEQLQFSPHGRLLAAVEASDFKVLSVYDVDDGARIAAISLGNQPGAKLFALANGHGFVTVDNGGRIVVHPVFENPEDFVAYLTKEFPDQLTPAQKRFYFIN
jgi:WD40 repeat protein